MIPPLNVILPIFLVILAFILKLFMDRSATWPLFIKSLYEVPVDVVFLALSFTTAFTIADVSNINKGICYFFISLIFSLIVVVLWRRATKLFEADSIIFSGLIFIVNGTMSSYILYKAINLIIIKVTP